MSDNYPDINFFTSIPEELQNFLATRDKFEINAVLIGKHIKVRSLCPLASVRYEPVFGHLSDNGLAVIFHYGVIVFVNASVTSTAEAIAYCQKYTEQLYSKPETENFEVIIDPSRPERVRGETISIHTLTKQHIEVISNALSKSVVLDYQENKMGVILDKVEPIARSLYEKGTLGYSIKRLLQHIGRSLLLSQDMAGKVEITEKPTILWDHPELEPLHAQLVEDLEIMERQHILNEKNALISNIAQTSLEVMQQQHGHRLEWYIIILIGIEILLQLYELFFRFH